MRRLLIVFVFIPLILLAQNKYGLLMSKFNLAKSYEKIGRLKKAELIYKEILNKAPQNRQFLIALNSIYLKEKNYSSSIDLLKQKIKEQPNVVDFYGMLGSTYYTEGNYRQAFETWEAALRISENPVNFRIIANYAINNRAFDEAIRILEEGEKITGNNFMFTYDLGNLYAVTMKFKKAANEYCKLLVKQPRQFSLVENRISTFLNYHGAFEDVVEVLTNYYNKTGKKIFLNLLSDIYIQKKKFKKAFEIVKKLDETLNDNGNKLFSFAREALSQNNFNIAYRAFKLFENKYPASPLIASVKLGIAKSLEEKILNKADSLNYNWMPLKPRITLPEGSIKSVISAYEEVSKLFANRSVRAEALFNSAMLYLNYTNDVESGKYFLNRIISAFPNSPYARKAKIEIAKILMQRGNFRSANKILNRLAGSKFARKQIKVEANFNLAKLNYWRGYFSKSLEYLNKITSDLGNDRANDALELNILITTFKKDSINLARLAKADYFFHSGKKDSARVILSEMSANKNLFLLNKLASFNLAVGLLAERNFSAAESAFKMLAQDEENPMFADKSIFLLGEINYFIFKNFKKARLWFQKLLENFPNSLYLDKSREMINSIEEKSERRKRFE